MLEQDPQLLRDNIQHCLDTTKTDVLIFIADDDVMSTRNASVNMPSAETAPAVPALVVTDAAFECAGKSDQVSSHQLLRTLYENG